MNRETKSIRISSIERAAASAKRRALNPNAIGNLIINGDGTKPEHWFSGTEFRNALLKADMPSNLPLTVFMGAAVTFEVLEITQELLDAGGGTHEETINGRQVRYTKPGKYNIQARIDISTCNFTPALLIQCQIKALMPDPRQFSRQPIAQAPATAQETIVVAPKPDISGIEEEDEILEPAEGGTNGGHVNLNG